MDDDYIVRQIRELVRMQEALTRLGGTLAQHSGSFDDRRAELERAVMNIESARWLLMEIEQTLGELCADEAAISDDRSAPCRTTN